MAGPAKPVWWQRARVGLIAFGIVLFSCATVHAQVADPPSLFGRLLSRSGAGTALIAVLVLTLLAGIAIGAAIRIFASPAARAARRRPVAPDAVRYADFAASATDWYWETDERHRLIAIQPATDAAAPPIFDGDLGRYFAELGLVET